MTLLISIHTTKPRDTKKQKDGNTKTDWMGCENILVNLGTFDINAVGMLGRRGQKKNKAQGSALIQPTIKAD